MGFSTEYYRQNTDISLLTDGVLLEQLHVDSHNYIDIIVDKCSTFADCSLKSLDRGSYVLVMFLNKYQRIFACTLYTNTTIWL